MWFEILPSAGIITVVLAVPVYAMWGLNKLTLGNVSKCWLRYIPDDTVNLYNCVLDRSASHLFNILVFNSIYKLIYLVHFMTVASYIKCLLITLYF